MQKIVAYLDTNVVTELDISDERTALDDNTSTLVSTDKRKLDGQRPVTVHGVEISVADTRVLDVDKNLIWTTFWDGNLLVHTCWLNC